MEFQGEVKTCDLIPFNESFRIESRFDPFQREHFTFKVKGPRTGDLQSKNLHVTVKHIGWKRTVSVISFLQRFWPQLEFLSFREFRSADGFKADGAEPRREQRKSLLHHLRSGGGGLYARSDTCFRFAKC